MFQNTVRHTKYDITFLVLIKTSNVKNSMMKSQGLHLYPINILRSTDIIIHLILLKKVYV